MPKQQCHRCLWPSQAKGALRVRRYGGRFDCAAVADVSLVVDSGEVVLPNYTGGAPALLGWVLPGL